MQWLKQRRKELDLTQLDLAERLGCSDDTIQKIEAGGRRPSRQVAQLLARCLEIPPEEWPAFVHRARAEGGGMTGARREIAVPPVSISSPSRNGSALPSAPLEAPQVEGSMNPYKGLRAFYEADAPDFFGRDALTLRLSARLSEETEMSRF